MSRSYKKYPLVKCEKSCKFGKRIANKKVRAYFKMGKECPNGSAYKKIYNSAEVCDYSCVEFKEWVITKWYATQKDKLHNVRNYTNWADEETLEEELILWYKYYKTK